MAPPRMSQEEQLQFARMLANEFKSVGGRSAPRASRGGARGRASRGGSGHALGAARAPPPIPTLPNPSLSNRAPRYTQQGTIQGRKFLT